MIYQNFEAFARELQPGRPILGLDLGRKTIGVAISDVEKRIATPYFTVRRKDQKKDMGRLWQIATERDVCGFVLGMPLNMDGSDGPRTQATRAFARELEMYMPRPLTFWDERLSTVFAERALIEADTSRAKRELVIDKVAAAVILQGALDRINFLFGGAYRPGADDDAPAPQAETPEAPAPDDAGQDSPEKPAARRAGRVRGSRVLPAAPPVTETAEEAEDSGAPKRDADAIRRRRMMTRRIDRDGQ